MRQWSFLDVNVCADIRSILMSLFIKGQLPAGAANYAPGSPTCRPTTFKAGGVGDLNEKSGESFGPG